MAMKPVAKKALIVIGAVYLTAVVMMIVASKRAAPTKEEMATIAKLHGALRTVEPEASPELAQAIYEERLKPRGEIIAFNYTMLLNILNFGILLFLMYGFLWDPMLKFLDERSREVAGHLDSAEQDRAKASAERAEANQELSRARDEHAQVRSRARHEAMEAREEIVAKAREEAHRLIQRTEEELQVAIETARTELRARIGDLACDVASRILEREIQPQDQEALVREFIESLEKTEIGVE